MPSLSLALPCRRSFSFFRRWLITTRSLFCHRLLSFVSLSVKPVQSVIPTSSIYLSLLTSVCRMTSFPACRGSSPCAQNIPTFLSYFLTRDLWHQLSPVASYFVVFSLYYTSFICAAEYTQYISKARIFSGRVSLTSISRIRTSLQQTSSEVWSCIQPYDGFRH